MPSVLGRGEVGREQGTDRRTEPTLTWAAAGPMENSKSVEMLGTREQAG